MAERPHTRAMLDVAAALAAGAAAATGGDARAVALVAAAGLVTTVAVCVAHDTRRGGIDVLLDAALGAGVVVFLGAVARVEVSSPDIERGLQVAVAGSGLVAVLASLSSAAGASPRRLPAEVLVGAAVSVGVAGALDVFDLGAGLAGPVLGASAGLLVVHALVDRAQPTVVPSPRLARVSFGRLTVVVVAVAAGPFTLAAAAVDLAPLPSSPIASVPFVVLALLGIVHLARQLDQRASLEHLALHDELTGLPNRVLFADRLERALADASWSQTPTTVLFVDVDRFKRVNDSLGHPAGDDLLQCVAQRLRGEVRDTDTVARLGGDEFAVLLPCCDEELGRSIATRMLSTVSEPVAVVGHEVFVGASIGIAVAPGHGNDTMTLLKNADAAMYAAKDGGRNRASTYRRELNSNSAAHLDLEAALHRALESNEGLVVHYQPKVDLEDGRIIGAEALVRWQHPTRGLLPPAEFIPLAEDTGLIVALGEWVLHRTCADLRRWTEAGATPVVVSVNLSARQFEHHAVSDIVASVLRRTGLDPWQLELELTESLALQDSERVLAVLEDVRSLGVSCSIDDFGTGYSGLNYLTRFPIDRLKIDRSFIAQIAAGGRDAKLVSALIALAHGLGLGVVAEGVETTDQLAFLRANGCDQMQGFLVSRPVPGDEFERMLTASEPVDVTPSALASVHVLRRAPAVSGW